MESIKIIVRTVKDSTNESSLLGVSSDTIFTVITTLIIFILGIVINKQIEANKEKRRLIELEEYFIKLIELAQKSVIKQADGFKDFADKLLVKKEQHFHLLDVSSFSMEPIKEIDKKDLYAIFIKRKKGLIGIKTELFRKLLANIEYIDDIKTSNKENFENFIKKFEAFQYDYSENLKVTSDAYDQMRTHNEKNNIKPQEDLFLLKLDGIRAAWAGLEKDEIDFRDRYIAREKYIEPVRILCRESIGDPRAIPILKHIMESIYAFDNLEELMKFYSEHYRNKYEGLIKSLTEIESCLKEFKKM